MNFTSFSDFWQLDQIKVYMGDKYDTNIRSTVKKIKIDLDLFHQSEDQVAPKIPSTSCY